MQVGTRKRHDARGSTSSPEHCVPVPAVLAWLYIEFDHTMDGPACCSGVTGQPSFLLGVDDSPDVDKNMIIIA